MAVGSVLLALLCVVSCDKQERDSDAKKVSSFDPIDETMVDSWYGYAEVTVPAGVHTVYLEYVTASGEKTIEPVAVSPEVAVPEDGKNVEPFGTVRLLLRSQDARTKVSVFYGFSEDGSVGTKGEVPPTRVYALEEFPLDQITFGSFGETRYVQLPWQFAFRMEGSETVKEKPADIVLYDEARDHTLRYRFAYAGHANFAYYLEDAYTFEENGGVLEVTGEKDHYCSGCGNCPYCMPWGCSCGCTSVNASFVPSGEKSSAGANRTLAVPSNVTEVYLEEPASYVTSDAGQTFYHSSGVVMFDDSWPEMNTLDRGTGAYDYDFNDVVADYDFEAKTVADDQLEKEGWREQLKVVLHVRAVGGNQPWRVGVVLEGFDQQWIESIEEHKTLDSWQNPHGELPDWTRVTLQENSLHYESNPLRPSLEIGGLQRYNDASRGAGNQVYIRIDDNGDTHETVFNPALKEWDAWKEPRPEQYSAALTAVTKPRKLVDVQKLRYYNTVPGYVNVDGGLYTYTVIYHLKPRAEMNAVDRQASLQNLIDAVMTTTNQNFYIIKQDFTPVGLKGYRPSDSVIKISNGNYGQKYNLVYDQKVAANADKLDPSISYVSKEGEVWAFKCPVMTKHVWEKYYFSVAYPRYEDWIHGDTSAADWYLHGDDTYLTCWW